jgi:hypothetical protein
LSFFGNSRIEFSGEMLSALIVTKEFNKYV